MDQARRGAPKRRKRAKRAPAKPPGAALGAMRTRLEVDERRAQLLAHGLVFFSAHAYDEVSIDDLAREAGISKGLLYHYFPTKRAFYIATLRELSGQLLARTESDRGLSPLERARAGLDAYLAYVERHGAAYSALLRSGIGSDPEALRVVEETRAKFLDRFLEETPEPVRSPRLRLMLRGFVGFVEATSLDWVERGEPSRA